MLSHGCWDVFDELIWVTEEAGVTVDDGGAGYVTESHVDHLPVGLVGRPHRLHHELVNDFFAHSTLTNKIVTNERSKDLCSHQKGVHGSFLLGRYFWSAFA